MRGVVAMLAVLLAVSAVAGEPTATPPPVTKAKVFETDRYGNKGDQAFVVKDNKVFATDRYGNKIGQAYVTKGEKVFETSKYGSRGDQAYVVKDKTPAAPVKK